MTSITGAIIQACFELSIEPHRVAKISGIGCSSKTPTYFLGNSHGFNSVHGRMPSVLTGANLANRDLIYLGVSGDGDSASIGLGQFAHCLRRGVNMVYIVENNGVYGLTKGQFSATADRGSKSKRGFINTDNSIDLVAMALQLGASFVARSFSGDKQQLVPIIKAAIAHKGAAFIDVISPCVAFNNHAGSTKSFDFVREHNEAVNRLDFISSRMPIEVKQEPGTVEVVEQHDGSRLALRKLAADYDVHDRTAALGFLQHHAAKGQIVTGLLYVEKDPEDLHAHLRTVDAPAQRARRKGALPWSGGAREVQRKPALGAKTAATSSGPGLSRHPLRLARHNAMDKRRLGQSDLHLAPLMLGGNVFGWNVDESTSFEILDAFVDAGFNAIDTADSYSRWVPGHPGGESETIIGNWLKKSGKRDKVLIATKVGEDMGEGRSLRKDYILRECEASLRRLQTDYIDLYQTHFDDEVTPPEETMQAYAELIAAGKVRAIGASNMTPARLRASLDASNESRCPALREPAAALQPLRPQGIRDRVRADLPAGKARRHQLLLARGRLPHRQIPLRRGRRQTSRARRTASSAISTHAACASSRRSIPWPRATMRCRRKSRSPG